MATSKSIQQRIIQETTLGTTPAGSMEEVALPGLDFSTTLGVGTGTSHVSKTRQPSRPIRGGASASASSTTNFDFLHGGKGTLLGGAFGAAPLAYDDGASSTIELVPAGNILRNSAGWGALEAGEMAVVSGASFNNFFLAPILSVSGNDAAVDPRFVTLPSELPGTPIHVYDAAGFRIGEEDRTFTYEKWNPRSEKGAVAKGCFINSWGFQLTYGDNPSALQQTFGVTPIGGVSKIVSPLTNSTTAATEITPFSSGSGFRELARPASGFGIRYNGDVLEDLHVKGIQVTMQSPTLRLGAAGNNEPLGQTLDGTATVSLSVTFDVAHEATDTAWETLRVDAEGEGQEFVDFGFGGVDGNGQRFYLYLPVLSPQSYTDNGPKETGADECTITYNGHAEETSLFTALYLGFFGAP